MVVSCIHQPLPDGVTNTLPEEKKKANVQIQANRSSEERHNTNELYKVKKSNTCRVT